jgi:alkylation response protein AidB-like acyl-CoA dehydrogenase
MSPLDAHLATEYRVLRETAYRLVGDLFPLQAAKAVVNEGRAPPEPLDASIASAGWLGFSVPLRYGGSASDDEGDALAGTIIHAALGYHCAPSRIHSTTVVARCVARFFPQAEKERLLPLLTVGNLRIAPAFIRDRRSRALLPPDELTVDGERRLLTGYRLPVTGGIGADYLLLSFGVGDDSVLSLIPAHAAEVGVRPLRNMAGESPAEVRFEGVVIEPGAVVRAPEVELAEVVTAADLLLAAELVGISDRALELAVDYAKGRMAFGRPIGSFQAIQHKLANVSLQVEAAREAVYRATIPSPRGVAQVQLAVAQIQAVEASKLAVAEATQVFGGSGLMEDNPISLYYRRAKCLQLQLPEKDDLLRIISDHLIQGDL